MVDFQFLIEALIGVAVLAAIALIGSNFSAIVSIVSGLSAQARTEGVARRAYRQRVYDMSTYAEPTRRTAIELAEPMAVLADAHQMDDGSEDENEPAREPVNLRQLPKQDLIVLLAVQRDEENKYVYSANDITKFVGGTAADVKELIAAVRAEKPAEQAARLGHLPRPANGWPATRPVTGRRSAA